MHFSLFTVQYNVFHWSYTQEQECLRTGHSVYGRDILIFWNIFPVDGIKYPLYGHIPYPGQCLCCAWWRYSLHVACSEKPCVYGRDTFKILPILPRINLDSEAVDTQTPSNETKHYCGQVNRAEEQKNTQLSAYLFSLGTCSIKGMEK